MKHKRKIFYLIQDFSLTQTFWWNRGDWRQSCDAPDDVLDKTRMYLLINNKPSTIGIGRTSSTSGARTFKSAIRKARRLKAYGGNPLITRFFKKNGKRYMEDFEL